MSPKQEISATGLKKKKKAVGEREIKGRERGVQARLDTSTMQPHHVAKQILKYWYELAWNTTYSDQHL